MNTKVPPINYDLSRAESFSWQEPDLLNQRLRLFSPWSISGFGLTVCIGLILAFPHKNLEQQLASSEYELGADRLTAEYLKVFLEADPDAHGLRLQLVRHLINLQLFSEARTALNLLGAAGTDWAEKINWLELEIREKKAYSQINNVTSRETLFADVSEQIQLLLGSTNNPSTILTLAYKALAIEDRQTSSIALKRLLDNGHQVESHQYANAAQAALSLSDYQTSSGLYFRAMKKTDSLESRRDSFINGLLALQSGALHSESIAAADQHIGTLSKDRETLVFLVRFAQTADVLDAAQRYALLLLQLAIPESPSTSIVKSNFFPSSTTFKDDFYHFEQLPIVLTYNNMQSKVLIFDEEAYELSYKVFLANRNLEDARLLAESAIRQNPENPLWRKRLAGTLEWTNKTKEALSQWLTHAKITKDEESWDNVLRLGKSLQDGQAVLAATAFKVTAHPNSTIWLYGLFAAYENAGRPELALKLLKDRLSNSRGLSPKELKHSLVLFAELAERMGRNGEAIDTWHRLQKKFGPQSSFALRTAKLLSKKKEPDQAYKVLEAAAGFATGNDKDFWRFYAEQARLLHKDQVAFNAYRQLIAQDALEEDLFDLFFHLEPDQPLLAARIAMFGFNKNQNSRFALLALSATLRAKDFEGGMHFLASMSRQEADDLQQYPLFLSARADISLLAGRLDAAEKDLHAALSLDPANSQYRSRLIWLLIAQRNVTPLKQALTEWSEEAEDEPDLWQPFASAYMALNKHNEALRWLRKSGFQKEDFSWLLSYAEVLDAKSQQELAWQIRRHVWDRLRSLEALQVSDPLNSRALQEQLASLAPLFANGDEATKRLRILREENANDTASILPFETLSNEDELLRHLDQLTQAKSDAGARQGEPSSYESDAQEMLTLEDDSSNDRHEKKARNLPASPIVRELSLSHALSRDEHALASAWLASEFSEPITPPPWAELSLALSAGDDARLKEILADDSEWLPVLDRIEATKRVGDTEIARKFAFEELSRLPQSDEIHAHYTDLATTTYPTLHVGAVDTKQGPLSRREVLTGFETALTTRTRVALSFKQAEQSTRDVSELATVPSTDRQAEAALKVDLPEGDLTAAITHRETGNSISGLRLSYIATPSRNITIFTNAHLNQPTTATALLRAGAARSGADIAAAYRLSKAEELRVRLGWNRFHTFSGTDLGSSVSWGLEASTQLRKEYPNLGVRVFGEGTSNSAKGKGDAAIAQLLPNNFVPDGYRFLPENDTLIGVSFEVGTVSKNKWSRKWRPYMDVGFIYSEEGGKGFNFSGGVAGNIFGQDTLKLSVAHIASTPSSPKGFRELQLEYKWFF